MTPDQPDLPATVLGDRGADEPRWGTVAVVVGAWLILLVVHVLLVLAFAGWLGTADDFLPWSVFAFVLLVWTLRLLGLAPLWRSAGGRAFLALWILLLVIAAAGVDEGRVSAIPALPAAMVYAVLPIAGTITVVIVVCAVGFRRRRRARAAT